MSDESKDPEGEAGKGSDAAATADEASEGTQALAKKDVESPAPAPAPAPAASVKADAGAKAEEADKGTQALAKRDAASPASATSTKADADSKKAAGEAEAERRDLPKWNRARVKRKAPAGEEQDAFQVSVRKAGRGILQRPWAVLGLMVAAAGVVAGIYAWQRASEGTRAESTRTLAVAVAYEARGQVLPDLATQTAERVRPLPIPVAEDETKLHEKVDAALADLEAQAPDSAANVAADLVRAARLAKASDFAGAEKAFRGFLTRQPGHALAYIARDGLVVSLEAQGRHDEALTEVEPLLGEVGDFFRDQALWHKGRLLEASGQGAAALEVYKQYMEEYPLEKESLAQAQVRARLEELDPTSVPALPEPGMPGMGMGGLQSLGGLDGGP